METSKTVEELPWSRSHTISFAAFAIGLLLEGYIFSLAFIASYWYSVPFYLEKLLFSWPYLWLIIGIAIGGPVSDKLGRKKTFIYSMSMYAIGGVLLSLSVNYVLVLISLAILLAAAGSEMNNIMTMAHEIFPRKNRSKSMMMLMDFVALASVITSAVSFLTISTTVFFGRTMAGVAVLLTLVVLLYLRLNMPESIRWLEKVGKSDRAQNEVKKYFGNDPVNVQATEKIAPVKGKNPPIWFKETVATAVAFSNAVGYGFMAYTLAPLFFPNLFPYIVLIAGVAGFVAGFVGMTGDKYSRKWFLTLSSVGVAVMMIIIAATLNIWSSDLIIFWILLVIFYAIVQIDYMTEDTLKGELWPTQNRGKLTALARVISIGAYIPLIYLIPSPSTPGALQEFLAIAVVVWGVGAIAAIAWHIWGIETGKGVSIGVASGEV
ncbi:MAG: MFS transporter [Nitrososphaerota archaeon]|jgi:MFS family permease|nr:MFS transporter [Nitrososphaerota archaeon]MDG6930790.1 MFS transporter [Nitrososphaerota archaeon]MDG6932960.1 MFS transporter [Nitrososphaerota archaeon]MDG6936462.1 MFS transporter [Nitrososphaerota archaeon]MDG6944709.1 MFS transporter [Nitrososphaerota archaeon]